MSWDPSAYGSAFAAVYDDWYGARHDVGPAVTLLDRVVPPSDRGAGSRLLELGVGSGRLAIPLATAGWQVTGLDASPEMLALLDGKGTGVVGVLGDAGTASDYPDGPFDVVLAAYNFVFNLPDRGRQTACLAAASGVAALGGALVIEAFVPDASPPLGPVESPGPVAGVTIVSEVDPVTGIVHGEHRHADGRRRRWRVCPATPDQLDAMARATGWRLEHRWEDWSGSVFDALDSPTHVSVYRRADSAEPTPSNRSNGAP